MNATVVMGLLWLLFAGSHLGVAASPLRTALIRRYGRARYLYGYIVVAQLVFAILPIYYATHRFAGPPGPALGEVPWARPILIGCVVAGLVLVVGALSPKQYLSSTTPFNPQVRQPHGLERITRHPVFVGLALWSGAHALLATHLIGTVFFGSFASVALFGTIHQERKLARELGAEYERYLRATSVLPFGAVLAGRQSVAWREQPWLFLALGGGAAWLLHLGHAHLFGWNGVGFALFFIVATSYFTLDGVRRARAAARQP